MPCVDHQTQQKRLRRVEHGGQQRDGHVLHTAAEGKGADEAAPQEIVALGGHEHAVGQPHRQIPGHDGYGVGKRGAHGGGQLGLFQSITSRK